jgi:glycosyltransferase involved in cell wall biosynthesis
MAMKKIFKILSQLGVVALLGFGLFKSYEFYQQNQSHRMKARQASQSEKSFVIIVPSFNNSKYCEKNLFSILSQNYANFRVVYIDDCSEDDTFEKVKAVVAQSPQGRKVSLVRNTENKGALANIYETIKLCSDQEIIVLVDGDDFLAHENVLTKLNRIYTTSSTWMTYGNFLDYPSYRQIPLKCKPFPKNIVFNNSYRTHESISTHLRTFYAGLFKQIRQEDLFYNGRFIPMAWDLAIMLPLLEMSGKHAHFVNDVLYLYNRSNPLNDYKVNLALHTECANYIKKLPKYKRLKMLPFEMETTTDPILKTKAKAMARKEN